MWQSSPPIEKTAPTENAEHTTPEVLGPADPEPPKPDKEAKQTATPDKGDPAPAPVALFISGQMLGGIVFLVIAFLISPYGILAIAEWLVDKLHNLNFALRSFIIG